MAWRADSKHVNKSVSQIVIDTAEDSKASLTFNYASEALNNDFFLDNLVRLSPFHLTHSHRPLHTQKPPADKPHESALYTSPLYTQINHQFHTLDGFVLRLVYDLAFFVLVDLAAFGFLVVVMDSDTVSTTASPSAIVVGAATTVSATSTCPSGASSSLPASIAFDLHDVLLNRWCLWPILQDRDVELVAQLF